MPTYDLSAKLDKITQIKLSEAINQINIEDLEIKVVIGPSNRNLDTLKETAKNSKHRVELLQNVFSMPEVMDWADLAVSAGGSTCWELFYMKVPAILIILADNQKGVVETLCKREICFTLGWLAFGCLWVS